MSVKVNLMSLRHLGKWTQSFFLVDQYTLINEDRLDEHLTILGYGWNWLHWKQAVRGDHWFACNFDRMIDYLATVSEPRASAAFDEGRDFHQMPQSGWTMLQGLFHQVIGRYDTRPSYGKNRQMCEFVEG